MRIAIRIGTLGMLLLLASTSGLSAREAVQHTGSPNGWLLGSPNNVTTGTPGGVKAAAPREVKAPSPVSVAAPAPGAAMASSSSSVMAGNTLEGTTWSGTDSDGDHFTFTFDKEGKLMYKSAKEPSGKGTWKQFGNALYYESNEHFSEALGEIRDGRIEGRSWNKKKHVWSWSLTRDN
jgi:hypothetical protein